MNASRGAARPPNKGMKLTSVEHIARWQLIPGVRRTYRGATRDGVRSARMPVISTFFGIVIRMYYQEHRPPHFHAEYQGQQATFDFDGNLLVGQMASGVAKRLIRDWAVQHRAQLEANWANMEAGRALERIEPLE